MKKPNFEKAGERLFGEIVLNKSHRVILIGVAVAIAAYFISKHLGGDEKGVL